MEAEGKYLLASFFTITIGTRLLTFFFFLTEAEAVVEEEVEAAEEEGMLEIKIYNVEIYSFYLSRYAHCIYFCHERITEAVDVVEEEAEAVEEEEVEAVEEE